jgi:DNA-binding response OmpR family regulator
MQFDGRGSKILIVDHDRTTLEMVQIRLDVAGFHAMSARSALAALEILKASRPDAVVLERDMPGMNGLELLREVASLPGRQAPPVLLVGRNLATDDLREGVRLGVRDVLAKPYSGAAVLERLTRMLKKGAHIPQAIAPDPAAAVAVDARQRVILNC